MEKKTRKVSKQKSSPLTALDEKTLFALMDKWWKKKVKPLREFKEKYSVEQRIVRAPFDSIARVLFRAADVLENRESAVRWLCEPCLGLGNATPIEILERPGGERDVLDVLGRIDHSVLG